MKKKNKVFIIAGPSGVGKNTVIKHLLKKYKNLSGIPTYTTRPFRQDDAKDAVRISIDEAEFMKKVSSGDFIEWKKIHQWYYGKKIKDAQKVFDSGNHLLLEIDVQGLCEYRKFFGDVLAIFIRYEKLDNLKERLRANRPESDEADLDIRYNTALKEMEHLGQYDYVITNIEGQPEIAIKEIEKIICERLENK